jgi:hypothetical protein
MSVRPASTANVEAATGRKPEAWFAWLDKRNARDLPHKHIARLLHDTGEVPGWWSRMLAVAYEQHIGRRTPGQDCTGRFRASATRTLDGDMDAVLARWSRAMARRREFSGVALSGKPETSATPKWRYWRCRLAEGRTRDAVSLPARVAVRPRPRAPGCGGRVLSPSGRGRTRRKQSG